MKKSVEFLGMGLLVSAALGGIQFSHADESAVSANVCNRSMADFQALAQDPSARVAFANHGGMLNGGVCWWHSRLQRSALYLTMYRPDLPRPSRGVALSIINTLVAMNSVVVIPGYANFNEFSRDYENEMISRLESWQRSDGILKFRWIDGLKGHPSTTASGLKYVMSRIHDMVTVQHRIVFEKLVMHGIEAHAWLIIGSKQTENGYVLDVIDSNSPGQTVAIEYREGDTSLHLPYSMRNLMPYLDFEGDLSKIFSTLNGYCHR